MKRDDEMTSQRFNKTIERKKEIIKAAMQLFSEKGYVQTSMRDIARTMGVSLGLCYRYFDSKQILFNTAIVFILKSVVIAILLFYMILLLRLKIR